MQVSEAEFLLRKKGGKYLDTHTRADNRKLESAQQLED